MPVLEQIQYTFGRFMNGRSGADYLALCTLVVAFVISVINLFAGWIILTILCMALYAWALFRMLSTDISARMTENDAFTQGWEQTSRVLRSGFRFLISLKTYKYFSCPNCQASMRIKRGLGARKITCRRCKHVFRQKS